ncbi:hypothetical protein GCM10009416_12790 [Craurococcus roseus]|uniref:OmpA-like domain-containing protein n=1 Tax=Craurococcus roseus TaxID=77585 RepID=A0ABP3PUH4_9PROT
MIRSGRRPEASGTVRARGARRGAGRVGASLAALLLLGGCGALSGWSAKRGASPYPQETSGTPPGPPQPLDRAATGLADALLARAGAAQQPGSGRRLALVVDPFVDRSTGDETAATRAAVARITEHVRARYPSVELRPLTAAGVADMPTVLLGSISGVTGTGAAAPADGQPRAYRMRAVLADPRTGRVLDAETALVRAEDAGTTPAPFFRDAPGWLPDPAVAAYLRTVGSRPGAAVDPIYAQGLTVGALVADGMVAYEAGRYRDALERYAEAQRLPAGDQMRVHNGLYLSTWALGRRREAEEAFARVVDFGLRQERLAVKFLFRPGSTAFVPDPAVSAPYGMWIRQIAAQTHERSACLLLTGHASPTGTAAVNDRLSRGRAEYLRARLVAQRARLRERTRAAGVGAREPLVGTGADNASDALDRRVEFAPLLCANLDAAADAVNSRAGSGAPGRVPL